MTSPFPRGLRALAALAVSFAAASAAVPAWAADEEPPRTERLQITDPYLEMHTGPGRGYPIHHVAARAEWVGRSFVLVDTGGFLPTAMEGRDAHVRRQAEASGIGMPFSSETCAT